MPTSNLLNVTASEENSPFAMLIKRFLVTGPIWECFAKSWPLKFYKRLCNTLIIVYRISQIINNLIKTDLLKYF